MITCQRAIDIHPDICPAPGISAIRLLQVEVAKTVAEHDEALERWGAIWKRERGMDASGN